MHIDPRLNEIDDCLYRVATKALIVHDNTVLLVQEIPEMWWGFPGGGIDHGEAVETALRRELEEELGVSSALVSADLLLAHYTIGGIVNGIPRMNLFYKVSLPKEALQKTDENAGWAWFSKDEFIGVHMSPSYKDRVSLAEVIFTD